MKHLLNRFRAVRDYRKRRVTVRALPPVIHAELTNACNLRCSICPRSKMTRPIGYMDLELADKIIREAAGKSEFVVLYGWGESLLHPQFDVIIRKFREKGFKTQLSINAMLLDDLHQEKIIASGLDFLILSIDAVTEQTYNKIRVGGDFNTAVRNVESFLAKARKRRLKMYCLAQCVYTNLNQSEVPHFRAKWRSLGAHVWFRPYSTWSGEDKKFEEYSPEVQLRYKQNVCEWPWYIMLVHWNGAVVPCCNDYDEKVVLGNVTQNSLEEIWNGEEMKRFRSALIQGRDTIRFCRDCTFVSKGPLKQAAFVLFDYLTSLKLQILLENYYRKFI